VVDRSLDPAPEPPPAAVDPHQLVTEAAQALGVNPKAEDLSGPLRHVEDPSGKAMTSFYEALLRTARREPNAVTRVVHFGDSLVVVDFLTGQARRRWQARFGDAGHGYMLAGKPWPWYQHWDVIYRTSDEWRVDGIMNPKSRGGYYGLSGYAFDGSGRGHYVEYATNTKSEFGRRVTRFEVHYLVQPHGGSFEVFIDGVSRGQIKTVGPAVKNGAHVVPVKDGPHKLRVECVGDGPVRLFGAVLERDTPGIVYDTLGINGGRARTLERIHPDLWTEQLRQRRPDLVILNFGTNESEDAERPMATVEADYLTVLRRLRAAVPAASCLVVSPADRASRQGGQLTTHPVIPRLVATQRRAALQAGCAFYDTYEAMGGKGSMAAWYLSKPSKCAGDLTHPNRRGADVLGDMIYRSLVTGLLEHTGAMLRAKAGTPPPVAVATVPTTSPQPPEPATALPEWPRYPHQ
jgi:lysophospholipase L1-like esterase